MRANKSKISAFSLFAMLYISRLVVSLTHVQSIMAGKLSTQMLMSVGLALVLSLLFAVPTLLCIQRGCSPLENGMLGTLYACNFIFLAGINVCRFAYFASARLNPETKSWGFALLIFLFAVYGALLGLQGLSRFSGFAFGLIALVVAVVLGFNVQHFQWFSLFPVGSNTAGQVIWNGVVLAANTAEINVFLVLADRVVTGGRRFGAFYGALGCSYLTTCLLFLIAIGVMGDAAGLQAFPVYTLSQLAGSGSLVRMDALYTGFWIFAIFIKAALLLYCAAVTLPGSGGYKGKCLGAGLAAFAVSCALGRLMTVGQHSPLITVVPFAVFSTLIPMAWLLRHRKVSGVNETNG